MAIAPANFSADLRGQVALVTGASAGLGVRFAEILAKAGAKVGLAARRVEQCEALAAKIRADGGEAIAIKMDATKEEDLIGAVATLEKAFGTVTILVNNGMSASILVQKSVELCQQTPHLRFALARTLASLGSRSRNPRRPTRPQNVHPTHRPGPQRQLARSFYPRL